MSGFVKVFGIGNLGKDPEVRFAASGTAIANLRVACTERVKAKDGNWEDHTEWVALVCFGKTAENAGQHLSKGRQVHFEGRLQTREWNDKEGNKRYSTEVVVDKLTFLGGGKQGERGAAPPNTGARIPDPTLNDDNVPY